MFLMQLGNSVLQLILNKKTGVDYLTVSVDYCKRPPFTGNNFLNNIVEVNGGHRMQNV